MSEYTDIRDRVEALSSSNGETQDAQPDSQVKSGEWSHKKEMVEIMGKRDDYPTVAEFVKNRGVEKLNTVVDVIISHAGEEMTYRIITDEITIEPGVAFRLFADILTILEMDDSLKPVAGKEISTDKALRMMEEEQASELSARQDVFEVMNDTDNCLTRNEITDRLSGHRSPSEVNLMLLSMSKDGLVRKKNDGWCALVAPDTGSFTLWPKKRHNVLRVGTNIGRLRMLRKLDEIEGDIPLSDLEKIFRDDQSDDVFLDRYPVWDFAKGAVDELADAGLAFKLPTENDFHVRISPVGILVLEAVDQMIGSKGRYTQGY